MLVSGTDKFLTSLLDSKCTATVYSWGFTLTTRIVVENGTSPPHSLPINAFDVSIKFTHHRKGCSPVIPKDQEQQQLLLHPLNGLWVSR